MLKLILLSMILLATMCCCTTNPSYNITNTQISQEERALNKVSQSVLYISSYTQMTLIDKKTSLPIMQETAVHYGSGSIIGQTTAGTLILTAAHVCDMHSIEQIRNYLPLYNPEYDDIKMNHLYVITDINDETYVGIQMTKIIKYDTCIILSTKIPMQSLEISTDSLYKPSKSFSLGFAAGIRSKDLVPVFEGYYLGERLMEGRGVNASVFSVRAAPGISGGPIVNSNGKLIGMVMSLWNKYDQYSFGATPDQIKQTIDMANDLYRIDKFNYDMKSIEMVSKVAEIKTSTSAELF